MANNAPGLSLSLDTSQNPNGVIGSGKTYFFGSKSIQATSATGNLLAWNSIATVSTPSNTTQTLPNANTIDIGKTVTIKSLGVGVVTIAPYPGNTYSGMIPALSFGDSVTVAAISSGVFAVVSSCLGTPVDPSTLTPWSAATSVSQYSERTATMGGISVGLVSPTARMTSASFSTNEAGFWNLTSQSDVSTFPVAMAVIAGFQITVVGQLWQATTTRTTSGIFDVTEQGFWTALSASSTGNRVNFGDFVSNGPVGLAPATVDKAQILSFIQITAGVSLTLPPPTATTTHRTIVLEVLPTSLNGLTFTLGTSLTIASGSSKQVQWNGTSWAALGTQSVTANQVVDTLYVTRSVTNQSQGSNWSSKDIIFNTVASGNIPFNTTTGVASLTAGKTYKICAELAWSCGGVYGIQWQLVDAITNIAISGAVEQVQATNGTYNISGQVLDFIYAPTTNQTVKLRTTSSTTMLSGETLRADLNTHLSIMQIGSSVYSGVNIIGTGVPGQPLLATVAGASFGDFTGGVTSSAGVLTVVTNANLTGAVTSVGNSATVVTNANLTGGVTSVGNATTVVTNANLSGAVTSVGNATSLPSLYGTDAAPVGAVASTVFLGISGMNVTAAIGTSAVIARANMQVLLRPALITPQATIDLNALYSAVQAVTTPALSTPATIGTLTLPPGVYDFGAAAVQMTGTLTLTGTSTDFWIFKTTGAFATTASNSVITMGGTATSANVFWLIGNNAPSLGANTVFRGTILNTAAIALAASMNIDGRVFSKAGAISVGAGTSIAVPAGLCTVVPMGCLSTFLAYTIAGACATTSTVQNYGDVGSGNTAPATWASYNLAGNVYGPTSMAARASYSLYVAGGLVPYSMRTYDSQTSTLVGVCLESAFLANPGNSIECRQQVVVGSVMVTNKILNVVRTS